MLRRRHEIGQHRAEERDGSSDAAGAVRNSGTVQSHLDPCQGAAQHQIVEMPEVADAEHLAAQFAETRSEEHTSELQSHLNLVCRLLLEKKKKKPKCSSYSL